MSEKIRLHIDTTSYNDKELAKKDFAVIKNRTQCSAPVEITIEDLIKEISNGISFSPAVMKGTKSSDFIEQQLFAVDIDNNIAELPILQIQDALNICNSLNLPVAFYYYSFSYTDIKPKYRLVFVLENPITNATIQNMIATNLCSLFEQADKSCVNADRVFFGTNKDVIQCDTNGRISLNKIVNLSTPKVENNIKEMKLNNKLERLKQEFDFCSYLEKRNDGIKSDNGNYVMFNKCEICGHNDDLVLYRDTNTFKCFGANGGQAGSIIDYLMAVENLTLSQAIDKFKYELCSIKKEQKSIESINAKDLLAKDLPKPYFAIKNMLCQGFTILGGPPKIGKSWLCLDLCISVCTGQPFLEFETVKSDCLYLALEDSYNRLQDRLKKVLGNKDIPKNFHLAINCEPLNEGLIEQLQQELEKNPNLRVIIIDTLQKVRGNQSKTESTYSYDYKEIGKLKAFADKNRICILAIHHLRKVKDRSDIFNQISGSTGLTGAADTSIVIDKTDNTKTSVIFAITGRDVESTEKLLSFDDLTFKWEVIGSNVDINELVDRSIYSINPIVTTINVLLKENPEGVKITASDLLKKIYEITGSYPKQDKPNSLSREINSNLQFDLLKYDGIHYEKANENGGSSGRLMYFSKPNNTNILK